MVHQWFFHTTPGVASCTPKMTTSSSSAENLPRVFPAENKFRASFDADGNDDEEGGSKCSGVEPLLTSIQYSNGAIFRGQVSGFTETGSFDWFSGMQYIGQYRHDRRNGFGELVWPDGSRYEGGFKDDLREGKGIHYWDTGEVYEGEYHKDKRHGNGVYTWPSGASFEGSFFRDLKEGPGKFTSAKGDIFEGMYHQDIRDGEGTLSYADGTKDSGLWKGGRLVQLKFAAHGIKFDPDSIYVPVVPKKKYEPSEGRLERLSEEFIMSAANNELRKIRRFVDAEVAHTGVRDANLCSPFFAAAMNGHCDIVEFLLDYGIDVDVNQKEIHGVTALNACYHIFFSGHPEVVRYLYRPRRDQSQSPENGIPVKKESKLGTCFSCPLIYPSSPITGVKKKSAASNLDDFYRKPEDSELFRSISLGPILHEQDRLCSINPLAMPPKLSPLLQRSCTAPNLKPIRKKIHLNPEAISQDSDEVKGRPFSPLLKTHTIGQCGVPQTGWPSKSEGASSIVPTASADGEILGVSESSASSIESDANSYKINSGEMSNVAQLDYSVDSESSFGSLIREFKSEEVSSICLLDSIKNDDTGAVSKEDAQDERRGSSPKLLPSLRKYQSRLSLGLDNMGNLNPFSSSKFGSVNSAAQSTSISCAISAYSTPSAESRASTSSGCSSKSPSAASPKPLVIPPYAPNEKLRKMIDLLLKRGADSTASSKPYPPLVYSVLARDIELSEKLLKKGADPHYLLPPELGEYPLIHLITKRLTKATPAMMELLLRYNVDPNLEYDIVADKPPQESNGKSSGEAKSMEKEPLEKPDATGKVSFTEKVNFSEKSGSLNAMMSVKKMGIVQKTGSAQKVAAKMSSAEKHVKRSTSGMGAIGAEFTEKAGSSQKMGFGRKVGSTERAIKPSTGAMALDPESKEKADFSQKMGRRVGSVKKIGPVRNLGSVQRSIPEDRAINWNASSKSIVAADTTERVGLMRKSGSLQTPLSRNVSAKTLSGSDIKSRFPGSTQTAVKQSSSVKSMVDSKSMRKMGSAEKVVRIDPTKEDESTVQVEDLEDAKIAGENEGCTALTPIHFICGTKLYGTGEEREKLYAVIPVAIQLLLDCGADVNRVFLGHSPLSMALLSGHDNATKMLLENGAIPDLPLGPAIGNALCLLTTHVAHKARLPSSKKGIPPVIPYTSHVYLAHNLLIMGASLVAPVRFARDTVGIVTDFAHAAFKTDRRLALVKYNSLSKYERMQYRSVKKVHKYLLNLLRCRALITVGKDENFWKQVTTVEEHLDYVNDIVIKLRILRLPAHSQEKKQALKKAQTCPKIIVLPELTLKHSLESIIQALSGDKMVDEDCEDEGYVVAPKKSKSNSIASKIARYKGLIEKAESIFKHYKGSLKTSWRFSDFCYECGKTAGVRLTLCTGCEVVSYCSRFCKTENWKKGHREECCKADMIKLRMLS